MGLDKNLYQAVIEGKRHEVVDIAQKLIASGMSALEIINTTLQPAMEEVGDKFSIGAFFLPELIMAANAMKKTSDFLKPYLQGDLKASEQFCAVIGTVEGDLHDIGKNLVIALLEGNGYEVIDLGVDVKPNQFVEAVEKNNPQVIGMSALLTTTMVNIPTTIQAISQAGLRGGRILAVGGASMTDRNAREWGAEVYAPDAGTAVRKINELLNDY